MNFIRYYTLAFCFLSMAFANAEVVVRTDFGTAKLQLASDKNKSKTTSQISGVIASGWKDDSVLRSGTIKTSVLDEQGKKFLRYDVLNPDKGVAQLVFTPFPIGKEDVFYGITLTVRNISLRAMRPYIRPMTRTPRASWTELPVLTNDWQTFSWYFQLKKSDVPLGLWLEFFGSGQIDLGSFQLERLTQEQVANRLQKAHPDNEVVNLFRNSRFPLGLQSGWSIGRGISVSEEMIVQTDSKQTGPTDSPALFLNAAKEGTLYSEPFSVVNSLEPHQVTVSVKGEGKWSFTVSGSGNWAQEPGTEVVLTAGQDWQRIKVPFLPHLSEKSHIMRVHGNGRLWLDGLRVAPVSQGDNYANQGECEVALGLPESELSAIRAQWESEQPQCRYAVSGKTSGAQLKVKVCHVDGDTLDLPPIALGTVSTETGQLNYGVFPQKPFGVFRIEAWVERDGKRISSYNELVVTRLRIPHYWKQDAAESHFGTHINPSLLGITEAKAIGMNWVRCVGAALPMTGWAFLEPKAGEWTFPDAAVQRFREHHLKILGHLGTAPSWASYRQDIPAEQSLGDADVWFQPKKIADWTQYVQKVTEHYKSQIDIYDVWNEPMSARTFAVAWRQQNNPLVSPFITSPFPQKDYANLLIAASDTAKKVNSKIEIVGINAKIQAQGASGHMSATDWVRGVMDFGGWKAVDIVGCHDFDMGRSGFEGDTIESGCRRITLPIQQRFPKNQKPLWMTEAIPPRAKGGYGFYNHTVAVQKRYNPVVVADEAVRFVVSALGEGVKKVFIYQMAPSPAPFLAGRNNNMSSLVTVDGYLNPSAAAISNLAWNVDPLHFDRRVEVSPGVYAFIFKNLTTATAVLALKTGATAGYKIPEGYWVKSMDLFGNPLKQGAVLEKQVVYVTAPNWLINMENLLRGKCPFTGWLVLTIGAIILLGTLTLLGWKIYRRYCLKPKSEKKS